MLFYVWLCCLVCCTHSALLLQNNLLSLTVPTTLALLPNLASLRLENNCLAIADPAALIASLANPGGYKTTISMLLIVHASSQLAGSVFVLL
jgi:hypothetical protein